MVKAVCFHVTLSMNVKTHYTLVNSNALLRTRKKGSPKFKLIVSHKLCLLSF